MSRLIGSICHLELYAVNLEQSQEFYSILFGWKTSYLDSGYMLWRDTGGLSGGFTTAGSPMTNPAATLYIKVESIPEMLEKIVLQGGTLIREKTQIGGQHGFYALFRDPAGNNIGLWCSQ